MVSVVQELFLNEIFVVQYILNFFVNKEQQMRLLIEYLIVGIMEYFNGVSSSLQQYLVFVACVVLWRLLCGSRWKATKKGRILKYMGRMQGILMICVLFYM
eukprot:TRINITY_DN9237_c0_g1_i6.p2 TRINITY_DN9237_c0_g1~~TRINITY_DN9237_c0_g1_i6.p2  ORF type:complete len:101 (-),score=5.77 TRINITY_DN9237_c0_g1_i6:52-354(-)